MPNGDVSVYCNRDIKNSIIIYAVQPRRDFECSGFSSDHPTGTKDRSDDKLYFMHIIVYIIEPEIVRNRKTTVLTLCDVLLL